MQLSDLQLLVTRRLGTAITTRFTDDRRIEALNEARRRILLQTNLEEFIKESTVVFTAGVGTPPADFLRPATKRELFDPTDASTSSSYTRVNYSRFDDNIDKTYTIKGNETDEFVIYIYSADTVSLTLRHFFSPKNMKDPADKSNLPVQFDNAHSILAAHILRFDDSQGEEGEKLRREYITEFSKANSRVQRLYGERDRNVFDIALDPPAGEYYRNNRP